MATYDSIPALPATADPLADLNQRNQHLRQEHDSLYREACKTVGHENDRLENQIGALRAQLAEHNQFFQSLPPVAPPSPQEASRPYQEGQVAYNRQEMPAYRT